VVVSFEQVFDVQTKQDEVFDVVARPVIDKLAAISRCFAVVSNILSAMRLGLVLQLAPNICSCTCICMFLCEHLLILLYRFCLHMH